MSQAGSSSDVLGGPPGDSPLQLDYDSGNSDQTSDEDVFNLVSMK